MPGGGGRDAGEGARGKGGEGGRRWAEGGGRKWLFWGSFEADTLQVCCARGGLPRHRRPTDEAAALNTFRSDLYAADGLYTDTSSF